jgi:hypothetical protein
MSRIDALPADQKAVLQLLLRDGSRYAALSELLDIDEAEVRRRAHGALDALGPAEAAGLGASRRGQIADYLLGQQDEHEALSTRGFLEGSHAGAAWARSVAAELGELADARLPEVPAGGTEDEDDAGAEAVAAAPPDGGRARPRASRRGGAILLGGLLIAAVAVILVFALRDSDEGGADTTPAASTATTKAEQPQVVAQANLVPPSNRKGSKALGVVLIQRASGQQQIVAAVQGLTKPKSGGYGIWLYSGPSREKWLGFFASQDDQGRLLARGELKEAVGEYREILVTREAKGNPAGPGPIFLRGPIQVANGNGG